MMAKLIDGRAIAEKVYVDLRRETAELKAQGGTPGLAVIVVGDNAAAFASRKRDRDQRRAHCGSRPQPDRWQTFGTTAHAEKQKRQCDGDGRAFAQPQSAADYALG